ncbi:hypothetical protein ACNO5E_18460 [Vibrio parahaemolyticus]|uniref:hypothetical protein n=1 Tax=Vibrio parahaemolyticus TaxID=670 RepID=UPI00081376F3|nr:hypothetical protein [Vibrio parahaemolyticus]OCP68432.1 hypothetical protein AKH08_16615 [Vibrio parahaemolyticus]
MKILTLNKKDGAIEVSFKNRYGENLVGELKTNLTNAESGEVDGFAMLFNRPPAGAKAELLFDGQEINTPVHIILSNVHINKLLTVSKKIIKQFVAK